MQEGAERRASSLEQQLARGAAGAAAAEAGRHSAVAAAEAAEAAARGAEAAAVEALAGERRRAEEAARRTSEVRASLSTQQLRPTLPMSWPGPHRTMYPAIHIVAYYYPYTSDA